MTLTTLLRPVPFARSSAASEEARRRSTAVPASGSVATPIDPDSPVIATRSLASPISGNRTTNSSPPNLSRQFRISLMNCL
jgi:hypothetical protein